jgi:hypothetical protein
MRWEFLEGVKAVEAADAVAAEFAKVLADELRAWPPRIEWTDPAHAARFAPLYASGELLGPRQPSRDAVREGFRLARWDLRHEQEEIDYYFDNDHGARACPDRYDRLALELVWRWLVEALLELSDRTGGRLKRRHLLDCLDRAERLAVAP